MAEFRVVLILLFFLYPIDNSTSEEIPFPEYNLGTVFQIVTDLFGNTLSYVFEGGFNVEEQVTYHCRTPSRKELKQVSKNDSNFAEVLDPSKKLVLIVHGFTDCKERNWIQRMVRDVVELTDSNACIVDWKRLATVEYTIAVGNVNRIGEEIGDFLLQLQHTIPLSNVSLIGHSLGAHISGAAGARTGSKIDAIYGIDPAHPLITFPMKPASERLDSSDAQFVQVLHTTSGGVGTPFHLGHQDWFADDGKAPQKGCEIGMAAIDTNSLAPLSLVCSHIRALEIFRFALDQNNKFKPFSGADEVLGYWSRRTPGVYYFPTVSKRPYVP